MRIPLFRGEAFEIIAFFALPPPGLSRGLGEASSHGNGRGVASCKRRRSDPGRTGEWN
ncbi:MAG: hypothetical protein WA813_10735 [Beijerinckiaceae bacterium]